MLIAGRRKIQAIINALKLPDRFTDMAQRFYTLALNSNFVRGRRTNYVVAACLYIVCRREKTSHMLIDFSDLLQVNDPQYLIQLGRGLKF